MLLQLGNLGIYEGECLTDLVIDIFVATRRTKNVFISVYSSKVKAYGSKPRREGSLPYYSPISGPNPDDKAVRRRFLKRVAKSLLTRNLGAPKEKPDLK